MNRFFLDAINSSGISEEVIAATKLIAANRAVATPAVLIDFTMYVEPAVAPTNIQRNTSILAMLAHYSLINQ